MRRALYLIAIGIALAGLAGCGGSDTHDDTVVGYNYWFTGLEPYDFSGPDADNPDAAAAASELLDNRIIDFSPSLSINVYPAYHESIEFDRTLANSYLDTYHGPGGEPAGPAERRWSGAASYAGGMIELDLEETGVANPSDGVTLEYRFDQSEAETLVRFMKTWRYEQGPRFGVSVDSVTAEVVIRGLEGTTGDLTCRQELHCVASHWIAF